MKTYVKLKLKFEKGCCLLYKSTSSLLSTLHGVYRFNLYRYVNADEFFYTLLTKIYQYQGMVQYCICGDFNSRLGVLVDYIEGVDEVPPRDILDFSKNAHGHFFVIF